MDITISIPQPTDAENIHAVIKRSWYATYINEAAGITKEDIDQMYADDPEAQIQALRNRATNPPADSVSLVAKDGERVIGFIRLKIKDDSVELVTLYVDPDLAGQGIGTKLWLAAEGYLPKDKPVVVEVASYTKAVDFYTKLGFVKVGEIFSEPMLSSGNRMPQTKMVLNR